MSNKKTAAQIPGFKSASLRSIVKAAGVTTGALYGYYDSKEALFEAQKKFAEIPPEEIRQTASPVDERLEHILITGMFHTFFELIIHEMPLEEARRYLKEMRDFTLLDG